LELILNPIDNFPKEADDTVLWNITMFDDLCRLNDGISIWIKLEYRKKFLIVIIPDVLRISGAELPG
jgi:hypothetical protein